MINDQRTGAQADGYKRIDAKDQTSSVDES